MSISARSTSIIFYITLGVTFVLNSSLHGQVCPLTLNWFDQVETNIPSDLSYYSLVSSPLSISGQSVSIENTPSLNAATEYNNTIYNGFLGLVENPYVLSINGDQDESIRFAMKFQTTVFDLSMELLDIDRNQAGFWQDKVTIKAYSGGFRLNITPDNIASLGTSIVFDDIEDTFSGIFEVHNANQNFGNVQLSFPGAIDSIVIDYTFGPLSTNSFGRQIIGVNNISFKSTFGCISPESLNDLHCGVSTDLDQEIAVLDNDRKGSAEFDLESLSILNAPNKGLATAGLTDGIVYYTPDNGSVGLDSLQYQICDDNQRCSSAWVYLNIKSGNPIYYPKNDQYALLANTSVTGNIFTNDINPSGVKYIADPTSIIGPDNGSLTIDGNGDFTYIPAASFNGRDGAYVRVCPESTLAMCQYGRLEFTVNSVVIPDEFSIVDLSEDLFIYKNKSGQTQVSDNLSYIGGQTVVYHYSLATVPSNGTATITADGLLRYTPKKDFVGSDVFTYFRRNMLTNEVKDIHVYINVIEEYIHCDYSLPNAADDVAFTCENQAVSGNVTINDSSNSDFQSSAVVNLVNGVDHGSLVLNENGNYTYFPMADYYGSDEFSYEVCFFSDELDRHMNTFVSLDIPKLLPLGANAVSSGLNTQGNGDIVQVNLQNVVISHGNVGELSARLFAPSGQSAYVFRNICPTTTQISLNFSDNATQELIPCPATNNGIYKPLESFDKFKTEDPNGTWFLQILDNNIAQNGGVLQSWSLELTTVTPQLIDCRTANVKILVMPKVKAPNAVDDCAETSINYPVSFTPLSNDSDDDNDLDTQSFIFATTPTHGVISENGDGSYAYTPDQDFVGVDYASYTICDTTRLCSTAEIKFVVSSVLAIEYQSFQVELVNNKPYLVWQINEDHDTDYFIVERSNGDTFESISKIKGENLLVNYTFYDTQLDASGTIYYRIKSVDLEGKINYTEIQYVTIDLDQNILVYPNPFTDHINIYGFNNNAEDVTATIIDMQGRVVYASTVREQTEIDLANKNLPSGMYLIKLQTETWEQVVQMIKN